MASYSLGVEIEMRAAPHTVRHPLSEKHALYYEKLAAALRNRGLKAKADNLQGIRRDPENYDAWWITKDGSLGAPDQLSKTLLIPPPSAIRARGATLISKPLTDGSQFRWKPSHES